MFSSLFPKKTKPNTITATAIKGDKSCNPEELEIISVISNKRKRHQRQRLSRNIIEDEKQVTQRNSDRVSRRQKKNKDKISHEQLQLNKVAAMELSNRLQDLSNKKNLREALELYWDNISVCDGHHASIIINCCSRCGAVEVNGTIINLDTITVPIRVGLDVPFSFL
jgi:transcriptional regulator of heat shock response